MIFHNDNDNVSTLEKDELKIRFGEILLPFRPLISFTNEINLLKSKKMLFQIEGTLDYDIYFEDKWIGILEYK